MHVTPMAVHLGGSFIIRQVFRTNDALPLGHRTAKIGKGHAAHIAKKGDWPSKEAIDDQADATEKANKEEYKADEHVPKEIDHKPKSGSHPLTNPNLASQIRDAPLQVHLIHLHSSICPLDGHHLPKASPLGGQHLLKAETAQQIKYKGIPSPWNVLECTHCRICHMVLNVNVVLPQRCMECFDQSILLDEAVKLFTQSRKQSGPRTALIVASIFIGKGIKGRQAIGDTGNKAAQASQLNAAKRNTSPATILLNAIGALQEHIQAFKDISNSTTGAITMVISNQLKVVQSIVATIPNCPKEMDIDVHINIAAVPILPREYKIRVGQAGKGSGKVMVHMADGQHGQPQHIQGNSDEDISRKADLPGIREEKWSPGRG